MNVRINLNQSKILKKVTNDKFGKTVSVEWKRLIDPYTPRDTGALMGEAGQTVKILPFELHYKSKYASRVYYGEDMKFQKINPYSTHHWDVAAENAGQKDKLYRVINSKLRNAQI
jgi:hypothetical protein